MPTWNYVTVHVTGTLRIIGDGELKDMLDMMIGRHEGDAEAFARNLDDKARARAREAYRRRENDRRQDGREMEIEPEQRPEARRRIVDGLLAAGDEGSRRIAGWMSGPSLPGRAAPSDKAESSPRNPFPAYISDARSHRKVAMRGFALALIVACGMCRSGADAQSVPWQASWSRRSSSEAGAVSGPGGRGRSPAGGDESP